MTKEIVKKKIKKHKVLTFLKKNFLGNLIDFPHNNFCPFLMRCLVMENGEIYILFFFFFIRVIRSIIPTID